MTPPLSDEATWGICARDCVDWQDYCDLRCMGVDVAALNDSEKIKNNRRSCVDINR